MKKSLLFVAASMLAMCAVCVPAMASPQTVPHLEASYVAATPVAAADAAVIAQAPTLVSIAIEHQRAGTDDQIHLMPSETGQSFAHLTSVAVLAAQAPIDPGRIA